MERRFWRAIGTLAVLAGMAATTLGGPIRIATLIFLGGIAVKTWIALLQRRQEDNETRGDADPHAVGKD
jgi:hypothetical protein